MEPIKSDDEETSPDANVSGCRGRRERRAAPAKCVGNDESGDFFLAMISRACLVVPDRKEWRESLAKAIAVFLDIADAAQQSTPVPAVEDDTMMTRSGSPPREDGGVMRPSSGSTCLSQRVESFTLCLLLSEKASCRAIGLDVAVQLIQRSSRRGAHQVSFQLLEGVAARTSDAQPNIRARALDGLTAIAQNMGKPLDDSSADSALLYAMHCSLLQIDTTRPDLKVTHAGVDGQENLSLRRLYKCRFEAAGEQVGQTRRCCVDFPAILEHCARDERQVVRRSALGLIAALCESLSGALDHEPAWTQYEEAEKRVTGEATNRQAHRINTAGLRFLAEELRLTHLCNEALLQSLCLDPGQQVRTRALSTVHTALCCFPYLQEVQRIWLTQVMPALNDPEKAVVERALELIVATFVKGDCNQGGGICCLNEWTGMKVSAFLTLSSTRRRALLPLLSLLRLASANDIELLKRALLLHHKLVASTTVTGATSAATLLAPSIKNLLSTGVEPSPFKWPVALFEISKEVVSLAPQSAIGPRLTLRSWVALVDRSVSTDFTAYAAQDAEYFSPVEECLARCAVTLSSKLNTDDARELRDLAFKRLCGRWKQCEKVEGLKPTLRMVPVLVEALVGTAIDSSFMRPASELMARTQKRMTALLTEAAEICFGQEQVTPGSIASEGSHKGGGKTLEGSSRLSLFAGKGPLSAARTLTPREQAIVRDLSHCLAIVGELVQHAGSLPATERKNFPPPDLLSLIDLLANDAISSALPTTLLSSNGGLSAKFSVPGTVRAQAFVCAGKICSTQGSSYARRLVNSLSAQLSASAPSARHVPEAVKVNVLAVFAELCVKYASLTDPFMHHFTACLADPSALVRKQCLTLLAALIARDYVKSKGLTIYRLLTRLSDSHSHIRQFAQVFVTRFVLARQPTFLQSYFLEMMCFISGWLGHPIFNASAVGGVHLVQKNSPFTLLSFPHKRQVIYSYFLSHMSEKDKLEISRRLVHDFLSAFIDQDDATGKTLVALPRSTGEPAGSALRDALRLLGCKQMKISFANVTGSTSEVRKGLPQKGASDVPLPVSATAEGDEEGEGNQQQLQDQSAYESGLLKRHLAFQILPTLLSMKRLMEEARSPFLRDISACLSGLLYDYRSELSEILYQDPMLAKQLETEFRKGGGDAAYQLNQLFTSDTQAAGQGGNGPKQCGAAATRRPSLFLDPSPDVHGGDSGVRGSILSGTAGGRGSLMRPRRRGSIEGATEPEFSSRRLTSLSIPRLRAEAVAVLSARRSMLMEQIAEEPSRGCSDLTTSRDHGTARPPLSQESLGLKSSKSQEEVDVFGLRRVTTPPHEDVNSVLAPHTASPFEKIGRTPVEREEQELVLTALRSSRRRHSLPSACGPAGEGTALSSGSARVGGQEKECDGEREEESRQPGTKMEEDGSIDQNENLAPASNVWLEAAKVAAPSERLHARRPSRTTKGSSLAEKDGDSNRSKDAPKPSTMQRKKRARR